MGTETPKNKLNPGTLLAAASIIGMSVGMVAAQAEETGNSQGVLIGLSQQDKHAAQLKYQSQQDKWHSSQLKGESSQLKYESSQIKYGSQQIKLHSTQQKGESVQKKYNVGTPNP